MPATMTIELKGLRFFAHHGWHDEEALLNTEFEVTILATVQAPEPIHSINQTVDYTRIYALAKTIFEEREKLLETIAKKMAEAIKKVIPELQTVQITITKLDAPIPNFTGTVGVTYHTDFK
ncbi:MAG TPA: dihydroneopterin aldolase [Chitinophagaceae bacterium]|nr:dihydroneopterin aldolase [Chitinophagaceae bacterium]